MHASCGGMAGGLNGGGEVIKVEEFIGVTWDVEG